jgi:hypothetical protein
MPDVLAKGQLRVLEPFIFIFLGLDMGGIGQRDVDVGSNGREGDSGKYSSLLAKSPLGWSWTLFRKSDSCKVSPHLEIP